MSPQLVWHLGRKAELEEGHPLFTRLLSSCCGEAGLGWALHDCDMQQATFSFQRVRRSLLHGLSRMCMFPTELWTGDTKKTQVLLEVLEAWIWSATTTWFVPVTCRLWPISDQQSVWDETSQQAQCLNRWLCVILFYSLLAFTSLIFTKRRFYAFLQA